MPFYNYACSECGTVENKLVSISKRDEPLASPCPTCGAVGTITRPVQAPMTSYNGVGEIYSKTPDAFRDVLRMIKSNSGSGCTIDV